MAGTAAKFCLVPVSYHACGIGSQGTSESKAPASMLRVGFKLAGATYSTFKASILTLIVQGRFKPQGQRLELLEQESIKRVARITGIWEESRARTRPKTISPC
jgi:hypothetical protein